MQENNAPTVSPSTPETPVQTEPITKPVESKKFPIIYLALGIIILALIATSGYLVIQNMKLQKEITSTKIMVSPVPSATPDPTANWQTYTNTTYNFSFKYPADFSDVSKQDAVSDSFTGNPQDIITIANKNSGVPGTDSGFYGFGVSSVSLEGLSFDNFITNEVSTEKNSPRGIYNEKINPITLSSGYQASYIDSEIGIRRYFIFNSTNNTAIVLSTASEAILLDGTMDQILSTFQFTNSTSDTSNWKTYTSNTEKASFKYPADWIVATPAVQTNYPTADQISLKSPSDEVQINWVSAIDGFGGNCLDQCPLITVVDKTPVSGANGLFVISGTITRDGKIYEPWLAIQDSQGIIQSGKFIGYDLFQGRNNGNGALQNTTAIFSTSGAYVGGPQLSQQDANAWFSKPDVQTAKQILLSLTY